MTTDITINFGVPNPPLPVLRRALVFINMTRFNYVSNFIWSACAERADRRVEASPTWFEHVTPSLGIHRKCNRMVALSNSLGKTWFLLSSRAVKCINNLGYLAQKVKNKIGSRKTDRVETCWEVLKKVEAIWIKNGSFLDQNIALKIKHISRILVGIYRRNHKQKN